ncbi:MAG: hypothetical protein Q9188_004428 [Gyalolechia gomerana]
MRHITEQDRLSSHERQSKPVGRSQSSMGLPTQQSSPVLNPPVCQSQLKQLASQETSKTVDNSRSPSGARPGASKQKDSKSFAQNLFDTTAIDKFLKAPTSVDKTAVPSNRQQKVAAKAVHPQPEEKESIDKADCEPVRRQGHHFEHKASHYLSSCKHTLDPPVDCVKTDHSCFNKTRRNPSSLRSPKPQQTLSHLSMQNVKALISAAQKSNNESLKKQHSEHHLHQSTSQATPAITSILSFARQSIAYVFSTPQALLASFREDAASGDPSDPGEPIDFGCMVLAFQWLDKLDTRPRLVMSSLSTATKGLRTPIDGLIEQDGRASELPARENIRAHSLLGNTNPEDDDFRAMNQEEATHVTMFIFAALIAIVPPCSLEIWCLVYQCHQAGSMVPNGVKDPATISSVQVVLDAFEDEMALDLLSKLCEVLAGRLYFSRTENLSGRGEELYNDGGNMVERLIDHVFDSQQRPLPYYGTNPQTGSEQLSPPAKKVASGDSQRYFAIIAEWLRYFIVKNWDGQAEIDRFSAVGGALEILWHFSFEISIMGARFDFLKGPIQWLERPRLESPAHLLAYPFVFSLSGQITSFRAINYARMFKKYEDSVLTSRLLNQMTFPDSMTGRGQVRVQEKLGDLLKSYFVLEIRRENLLVDALNQLWRRGKREMMKPLKVRMGMDEGEEGVDHGGVQQEFFRIAISEVMNPDYGMFTIDEQSKMAWFRPCPLEPMYKFELVGLLFSLAIYNGLTLPVNFPLAFYRKLQGLQITLPRHIEDGWPVLAKGLQSLLDWSEGDVADVFARTYEFTAEGPGLNITVDMQKTGRMDPWVPAHLNPEYCCRYCATEEVKRVFKPEDASELPKTADSNDNADGAQSEESPKEPDPPSPASDSATVTNANRKQYVSDYIFWLTDKSIRSQFEAFANNFFTCISTRAPGILNVRDFKRLVEGTQDISIEDLQAITSYDGGYTWDHPTIRDFWDTVRDFSPEQIRLLLEFVTACDRIPATGMGSVSFSVQRNGEGDERLPTSLTCYGRLLLPAYSCKEVMREKLCLAIENCKGFGVP